MFFSVFCLAAALALRRDQHGAANAPAVEVAPAASTHDDGEGEENEMRRGNSDVDNSAFNGRAGPTRGGVGAGGISPEATGMPLTRETGQLSGSRSCIQ